MSAQTGKAGERRSRPSRSARDGTTPPALISIMSVSSITHGGAARRARRDRALRQDPDGRPQRSATGGRPTRDARIPTTGQTQQPLKPGKATKDRRPCRAARPRPGKGTRPAPPRMPRCEHPAPAGTPQRARACPGDRPPRRPRTPPAPALRPRPPSAQDRAAVPRRSAATADRSRRVHRPSRPHGSGTAPQARRPAPTPVQAHPVTGEDGMKPRPAEPGLAHPTKPLTGTHHPRPSLRHSGKHARVQRIRGLDQPRHTPDVPALNQLNGRR